MSLYLFKQKLVKVFVVVFIILYGLVFYSAGKYDFWGRQFSTESDPAQKVTNSSLERPLPYADTQTPQVIAASVKLCANTVYGYQLAYPGNWFTTYNQDEQKCHFFAPYSFVVPQAVDTSFVPVEIEVIPQSEWEDTVVLYENPNDFYNVISSQNIQIGDRSVKLIETASTGASQVPRGFAKVSYLIFDTKAPLRISYVQLEAQDNVATYKDDLKQIAQSLKYF